MPSRPPKNKIIHSASAPIAFWQRIHNIKIDKFSLLGNDRVSPEWESALLPIFGSSGESNQDFCRERACCHIHFATGSCCVIRTHYIELQLALKRTLFHAIGTHPSTNNTPSPANIQYSLTEHSTSPITLEV